MKPHEQIYDDNETTGGNTPDLLAENDKVRMADQKAQNRPDMADTGWLHVKFIETLNFAVFAWARAAEMRLNSEPRLSSLLHSIRQDSSYGARCSRLNRQPKLAAVRVEIHLLYNVTKRTHLLPVIKLCPQRGEIGDELAAAGMPQFFGLEGG
jgi:hypothetical protein